MFKMFGIYSKCRVLSQLHLTKVYLYFVTNENTCAYIMNSDSMLTLPSAFPNCSQKSNKILFRSLDFLKSHTIIRNEQITIKHFKSTIKFKNRYFKN